MGANHAKSVQRGLGTKSNNLRVSFWLNLTCLVVTLSIHFNIHRRLGSESEPNWEIVSLRFVPHRVEIDVVTSVMPSPFPFLPAEPSFPHVC